MATANKAKDTITETATEVADKAKDRVETAAETAKARVAEAAAEKAQEFDRASDAFRDSDFARQATAQVADTLTNVAHAVRDTDFASLQSDVTEFARRNPLVFFGGAAALGFVAARAMKASERAEIDARASMRHDYPSVPDGQRAYTDQNAHRWGYV
ncbi:hypothetical protein [Hasllibacter sp. MH4015]|uniref:hypothetical protein n=1 Tax=Hasllibacter sp. MH4015 TaxID=2854029 RepID=UPI001CD496EA|nr:hypothetical protein [Hasllibacter sp. MH4015]